MLKKPKVYFYAYAELALHKPCEDFLIFKRGANKSNM